MKDRRGAAAAVSIHNAHFAPPPPTKIDVTRPHCDDDTAIYALSEGSVHEEKGGAVVFVLGRARAASVIGTDGRSVRGKMVNRIS
jgi:hypothetical protein